MQRAQTSPAAQPVSADDPAGAPFRRAAAELSAALTELSAVRPELAFEREPPPQRLAPFAMAVSAALAADAPAGAAATGKFVLLSDPAGQAGWDGIFRVICLVHADLEPEMAADPLLNAVGWSWLTEALDGCGARYRNISGTVTTVRTEGFGAKLDEPVSSGFELRASWSPDVGADSGAHASLAAHLAAWCTVICSAAGLPPPAPGVAALRSPRRRRRP